MTWLAVRAFLKANWLDILILAFVLGLGTYIEVLRVETHHYQKKIAAYDKAAKEQEAKDAQATKERTALINQKDAERETQLLAVSNSWSDALASLQRGADQARQPVRPVTICGQADRDDRLSGAVERTEREIDDAIREYQVGAGQLLESASRQQVDLVQLRQIWAAERVINK